MKSDWIDVKDKLPFEEPRYEGWDNIVGEFLVTVELAINKDPNDDPEVMILYFDMSDKKWKDYNFIDYEWGWAVTHWQEKPRPFGHRK